ncbi:MAG: hypothetical protein P0Y53_17905 [Candidatus Pseudobacter hemicellulosilyticus]|uniref:Tetratricopeptide repeat protein n=1 Tax=Candidatus Pseudobacter hemicellulosilyticus TaxID=3121375 RepID=A0AAJ5WQS4_9BACT|nr:MAG: hypothetical protein P0Y53_17905 [Pseudobacter sp.]
MRIPATLTVLLSGVMMAQAQQAPEPQQFLYYQRYQSARDALHTQLKAEPANARTWYWLSQAYLQNDQIQAFKDTMVNAPAAVVESPLFTVVRGHLSLLNGQADSAHLYFEKAMSDSKNKNVEVLAAVARAHVDAKAGDGNQALLALEKAFKREKKDPVLFTLQGDAYRKLANGTEAYRSYEAAIANNNGQYAPASFQLGKIFVAQKNPELYVTYFEQAIKNDAAFAPAYYELYYHYYFLDVAQASANFKQYVANTDTNPENDLLWADLLYLGKAYDQAITKTNELIAAHPENTSPRLYKLLAYSYLGKQDTATALNYMHTFLAKEVDSNYVLRDYDLMAELYATQPGKEDSAALFYQKALTRVEDSAAYYGYYKKLGNLMAATKNYSAQAGWLGKYYDNNARATNLDLFNWGLAHFRAEEYQLADTVFGTYIGKYPEQGFGYYWRARSNALMDSGMVTGTAIPHYEKLIAVLELDTSNATNRKWLVESYGYIAAYQTNTAKDFPAAISYLEKVLTIDRDNKDAARYIEILEKNMASTPAAGASAEPGQQARNSTDGTADDRKQKEMK